MLHGAGCFSRQVPSFSAGANRPCGVAVRRAGARRASASAPRWTATNSDDTTPRLGPGSGNCSSGSRVDTIDADWAAFPKPGLGRFHQPLAATGAAAPSSSGGGLQTNVWEHACNPLLQAREVYVILFGADGSSELEGIYSLRSPGPDGLPCETIIAFESHVDAQRYCGLVEAAMDNAHAPAVWALPPQELAAFCTDHAYQCRLEVSGSLLMPPDRSVVLTDWERALRLRRGIFEVLPEEPDLQQQQQQPLPNRQQQQQPEVHHQQQQPSCPAEGHVLPHAAGEMTRDQLTGVAAALEALLKRQGPLDSPDDSTSRSSGTGCGPNEWVDC